MASLDDLNAAVNHLASQVDALLSQLPSIADMQAQVDVVQALSTKVSDTTAAMTALSSTLPDLTTTVELEAPGRPTGVIRVVN